MPRRETDDELYGGVPGDAVDHAAQGLVAAGDERRDEEVRNLRSDAAVSEMSGHGQCGHTHEHDDVESAGFNEEDKEREQLGVVAPPTECLGEDVAKQPGGPWVLLCAG
jgi:hypothetical protein